jgi:hypothetical protein
MDCARSTAPGDVRSGRHCQAAADLKAFIPSAARLARDAKEGENA